MGRSKTRRRDLADHALYVMGGAAVSGAMFILAAATYGIYRFISWLVPTWKAAALLALVAISFTGALYCIGRVTEIIMQYFESQTD